MSRKLSVSARRGGPSGRAAESLMVAIGGELDIATAPQLNVRAMLDELTDGDLLARCRRHAPGSRERAAACEVLVRRYTPLVRACASTRTALNRPRT